MLLLLLALLQDSASMKIKLLNKSTFSSFERVLHQMETTGEEIMKLESSAFAREVCKTLKLDEIASNCISGLDALHEVIVRDVSGGGGGDGDGDGDVESRTYSVDLELPLWLYEYNVSGVHHETIFGHPSDELWPSSDSSFAVDYSDSYVSDDAAAFSLNSIIDAAARKLNVVKSESTDLVFISPNVFVGSNSKGRGVFASSPIPRYTMVELAPALLVQESIISVKDTRLYSDAPASIVRNYLYPSPIGRHSFIVLGYAMLYNHCPKSEETVNWEWVRYEREPTGTSEDDEFRYVGFAVRLYTVRDVPLHGELCWDYGSAYWSDEKDDQWHRIRGAMKPIVESAVLQL